MKKEPYVVLDIETTGLSRHSHRITEIAAIKFENNKLKRFQSLINPEVKIPLFITSLTGIDDNMVKNSPKIEEIMPKFISFLDKYPIVAHCASFDHGFLNYNSKLHLSEELVNPKICTRKLSKRLLPQLDNYKLSTIAGHFKLTNELAHRAMPDAEITHKIFINLQNLMIEQGINNLNSAIEFQDSKLK